MDKKYVLAIDQSTQGDKGNFILTGRAIFNAETDLRIKQLINETGYPMI